MWYIHQRFNVSQVVYRLNVLHGWFVVVKKHYHRQDNTGEHINFGRQVKVFLGVLEAADCETDVGFFSDWL